MGMTPFDSVSNQPFHNDRLFIRAVLRGENELIERANPLLLRDPGIYCIFNSETNMLYIGCSNDVANRIQTHKRHLSNGEHICKQMNVDYLRRPEAFRFFCIEYIQERHQTYEAERSSILNRETQYMKKVPHTRLYNNAIPVSLSERLLATECPATHNKIPITEVCRRLDMSPDSIRTNGFSMTDELNLTAAIEFVRKRTVANGRWAQDKAAGAIEYLSELEGIKSSNTESNEPAGDLLLAGGSFDYFDDLVVSGALVSARPAYSIADFRTAVFDATCIIAVVSHSALIWYDCAIMWETPGIIGGGMAFIFACIGLLIATDSSKPRTSAAALWFMFVVDCAAWFVHYPTFKQGASIGDIQTGALCGFICLLSFAALYLYQDSKLD